MRTLAILPVKSFGAAKQRLAESLGAGVAPGPGAGDVLGRAGCAPARRRARRDRGGHRRPRPPSPPLAGRACVVLADTDQAGQSQAAQIGIRHALAHGFDRVLLVPGDTPLAAARRARRPAVAAAAPACPSCPTATAPAPTRSCSPRRMRSSPSFGPGSRDRHVAPPSDAGVPAPDRRGGRRSRSTWTRPTTSRRCRPSWSSAAARRRPPAARSVSSTAPALAPVRASA